MPVPEAKLGGVLWAILRGRDGVTAAREGNSRARMREVEEKKGEVRR